MLPHTYELPAAILFVLGGALSCFAGYRFFRLVLAINGFIAGAALASSMMAASNTAGMVAAAIVGGLAGAIVLVLAYFVGIALTGAALGALATHLVWSQVGTGDPPWVAVIVIAILGAIAAMMLQRYVIVVATAFGGAWMIIVGGFALASRRTVAVTAQAVKAADVWILYPFTPDTAERWVPVAWIALGLVGTAVQLGTTRGSRRS
jgi:Domain of unknown function (DUF4203)